MLEGKWQNTQFIHVRLDKNSPQGNKINCLWLLYDLFYQPQIFPQERALHNAWQDKRKFICLSFWLVLLQIMWTKNYLIKALQDNCLNFQWTGRREHAKVIKLSLVTWIKTCSVFFRSLGCFPHPASLHVLVQALNHHYLRWSAIFEQTVLYPLCPSMTQDFCNERVRKKVLL